MTKKIDVALQQVIDLSQRIKTASLTEVSTLWPKIAHVPFKVRTNPLILAAGAGRADLVEFLLPFFGDEDKHWAYETSAQKNHLSTLQLFIGHVDPNGNRGQALQWAMANKDYHMMDFLLSVVNPKEALAAMKPAWGETAEWMYVNDYVQARASATNIRHALDDHASAVTEGQTKVRKL